MFDIKKNRKHSYKHCFTPLQGNGLIILNLNSMGGKSSLVIVRGGGYLHHVSFDLLIGKHFFELKL